MSEETVEHRFWVRGAWGGGRANAIPDFVIPDLQRRFSDGVVRTGVLLLGPALAVLAEQVAVADPGLPP
eukprot:1693756-Lingulodinium_polyedra.AAC.1